MDKLFNLFERLVLAVERLAFGNTQTAGTAAAAAAATVAPGKPARGRPRKETPPPPPADDDGLGGEPETTEPEDDGLGGDEAPADDDGLGGDDEAPATKGVVVTKEVMKDAMLEYQTATDGKAARALLKANTSTKSEAFNTVKPEEYEKVYRATCKALAALKKK